MTKTKSKSPVTSAQRLLNIAAKREVHAAFEWFRKRESEIMQNQVDLLKVPAPPFAEGKRAEWLRQEFVRLELDGVHLDVAGNVIGFARGSAEDAGRCSVMLSAHIDTVFPADTKYEVVRSDNGYGTRLSAPGASDNAAGVVALLAIAKVLRECRLTHRADIMLVGNVGEEGEGDLRGMRHIFTSEFAERIAHSLIIDGTGTDAIVTQALGSRRFEVKIHGPGGHSWQDYGRPNPINAMARAIGLFQDTPIPHEPRTTVNVGMICGGTSVNTIPETVTIRVDIRSIDPEEIQRLEEALRKAVQLAVAEQLRRTGAKRDALRHEVTKIGDRPAAELKANAHIFDVVKAVDAHLGIRSQIRRSSTDANIPLALGREAVSIGAGGSGGGAHTLAEWFDSRGRDLALKRILLATLALSE